RGLVGRPRYGGCPGGGRQPRGRLVRGDRALPRPHLIAAGRRPDRPQDGVTAATGGYQRGGAELRQRSGRGAGCVTMPRQADANVHFDVLQAVVWNTESVPGPAILLSFVRSPGVGSINPRYTAPGGVAGVPWGGPAR